MKFCILSFGVGYCFIRTKGNARSQRNRIKRDIVPTPFFIYNRLLLGNSWHKKTIAMKQFYEEPQVEVVEMEVEGAVMDGSLDPGVEG